MKLIQYIILSIFLSPVLLKAQEVMTGSDSTSLESVIMTDFMKQKKLNVNVEFGTYFTTAKGLGSGFGTYIAPQFGYQVSPRLRVSTGIKVFQNQGLFGLENSPYYRPSPINNQPYGTLLYVRGDYRLTEKLSVSGTAYKQVDLFRLNQPNQPTMNYDYQGLIMGIDYQLGENFFIHGEVEFSNGYNSFRHQNPFMHNQLNDPFRNSSFQR